MDTERSTGERADGMTKYGFKLNKDEELGLGNTAAYLHCPCSRQTYQYTERLPCQLVYDM